MLWNADTTEAFRDWHTPWPSLQPSSLPNTSLLPPCLYLSFTPSLCPLWFPCPLSFGLVRWHLSFMFWNRSAPLCFLYHWCYLPVILFYISLCFLLVLLSPLFFLGSCHPLSPSVICPLWSVHMIPLSCKLAIFFLQQFSLFQGQSII